MNSEKNLIKICYVPSLGIPIIYWRIENYANELLKFTDRCRVFVDYLTEENLEIAWDKICLRNDDTGLRIRQRIEAMFVSFDVIIFQKIQNKEALQLIEELRKKFPKTKIIAEVDDYIGDTTPSNIHRPDIKYADKWAASHCAMSDGIICSTEYLGKTLERFNKNIYVAPNCINPDFWIVNASEREPTTTARIGYVSGGGHDEDLRIAYRAIDGLIKNTTHPNIKFVVRYGGFRPDWLVGDWVDFQMANVHISRWAQFLYDLQITLAVAPLRDTQFNRCKSNLKWLEWASLGIPLIASNVEPYRHTKGDTYLVENDVKLWENTIASVLEFKEDNAVRLKRKCLENYSIHHESKALLDWIEKMVE